MSVKLENNSIALEKGTSREWYQWKVFVSASDKELNNIENVTYFLHPTFPEPVIEVKDISSKFALEQIGWGEFQIKAKIKYKDGKEEEVSHWLKL